MRATTPLLAIVLSGAACAPRLLKLPEGPGDPLPDFTRIFTQATEWCGQVTTLTAEVQLAGRAGRSKLRGRVLVGLAAPASLRLEAVSPFGAPAFILVAEGPRATLLLPRDNRVLANEPPAAILEALAGVALSPADLRALLSGCVAPDGRPVAGRAYDGWAAIDVDGDTILYLQQDGGSWRVRAGVRRGLHVEYREFVAGRARQVRVRTDGRTGAPSDLTLTLSQVESNVALDRDAFSLTVPADAEPLTLQELRDAGPLGRSAQRSEPQRQ